MNSSSNTDTCTVLAFGAHPDDIEFGCGGVIARETQSGRTARFVICSQGESSTHGVPERRVEEAKKAAALLGAGVEFIHLGGDAHFEVNASQVIRLAEVIRRSTPTIVLAPTPVENQHPDHAKLGRMVRDATRVARYGGVKELRSLAPHAVEQLLFFAVTPGAEPKDGGRLLIDVSDAKVVAVWKAAMEAHVTQRQTREYGELQLARARLNGLLAGVTYAIPLWPNDDLVFDSLAPLQRSARRF
ncbi:MAG TPA: PIG-L family deacetylase [Opitutaceae bacterium]|nr:PIG-L family deacetylase [Opitutaceae bacterium]